MKLSRIISILFAGAGIMVATTSCEDMLDTTSNGYQFDKDHKLDSTNDSFYSAMGILTQMQSVGERYVLLGELRGDLVEVPSTARLDYQQVSSFSKLGDDSPLLSRRDYYAIINNCNVALSRMDTDIIEHGEQVMMPEYASIVAMRSWAMLQVALNFGDTKYMTEPVLSIDDSEREFETLSLDQLVPRLISDLEPYAKIETPNYGTVDGLESTKFFVSPALLLGDLYLYDGRYEMAAATYYDVIYRNGYTMDYGRGCRWTSSVRTETTGSFSSTYSNESITNIPYASDAGSYHPDLVNLTYNTNPSILPARWFVDNMNTMTHFHIDNILITNISGTLEGDLRGVAVNRDSRNFPQSFGSYTAGNDTYMLISKYYNNSSEKTDVVNTGNPMFENKGTRITRNIALCRIPHVYLRYAEAVNRAGKPSLAFASLKYGLRGEVLENELNVNPEELADKVEWTNFSDPKFDGNYGTAMRGRGLGIALEKTDFVIPDLATRSDSIDWVEERILEEMAAETAFEGNRFFDLLRISRHRPGHPAFMAGKIARRFDDPAEAEARLSNIEAYWIK